MNQKITKENAEFKFWQDMFKYRQETYVPEPEEEYWIKTVDMGIELYNKYKDEPFAQMAADVIVAHQNDLSRRLKEMRKVKELEGEEIAGYEVSEPENEWTLA